MDRSKWGIITLGNDYEEHGPALPKNLDDLHAINAAFSLIKKTGARYLGHFPYTSDRVGECARLWSPNWIDEQTFLSRFKDFIDKNPLKLNVLIINGHGGNSYLADGMIDIIKGRMVSEVRFITSLETSEELVDQKLFPFANWHSKNASPADDPNKLAVLFKEIVFSGGHAGHLEHTLAAALGVLDWIELINLNGRIKKDGLDKVSHDHPAIAGLSGYHESLPNELGLTQNDRYGLDACRKSVEKHGEILVYPKFGELLHSLAFTYQIEIMKNARK
jgi:hypothetical protein